MLGLPSLVGDQGGLCDHDRFRGDGLPFASLLRPAAPLSTLHPQRGPRCVQDSVLPGWLGVRKGAFAGHRLPACWLGALPTDPHVRDERIRFLGSQSVGTTLAHHCAALQTAPMLWTILGVGKL